MSHVKLVVDVSVSLLHDAHFTGDFLKKKTINCYSGTLNLNLFRGNCIAIQLHIIQHEDLGVLRPYTQNVE